MNILKNLFWGLGKTRQSEPTPYALHEPTILEPTSESVPPVELFVDNEVPQPEQKIAADTQNVLTMFLNRNYHSMGINDGFEYLSNETLETGKKKIRASFQLIVDQILQEKSTSRLQINNLMVDVSKVSEDTRQKLENTVDELNSSMDKLQKQKELSAENEGWVMNAIHSYHQGFVQGMNDFILGENLLNSIKNI
ncbi:MAG: hypothetical protein IPO02_11545 [Bacteroidetes bacterium]|nr:hypothetical protein [Bacteroidota bacterium]